MNIPMKEELARQINIRLSKEAFELKEELKRRGVRVMDLYRQAIDQVNQEALRVVKDKAG